MQKKKKDLALLLEEIKSTETGSYDSARKAELLGLRVGRL